MPIPVDAIGHSVEDSLGAFLVREEPHRPGARSRFYGDRFPLLDSRMPQLTSCLHTGSVGEPNMTCGASFRVVAWTMYRLRSARRQGYETARERQFFKTLQELIKLRMAMQGKKPLAPVVGLFCHPYLPAGLAYTVAVAQKYLRLP